MQADIVIIGAGSAGCVLASRLSEHPGRSVLLLEAGPDHRAAELPAELRYLSRPVAWPYNWGDRVASGGRELNYGRGRGVGGSSQTNGAVAMRPEPEDFAGWPAEVGWDQMLGYLTRIESDLDFGAKDYHGADGPIPILRYPESDWTPLQRAFVEGCVDAGLEYCPDHSRPGSTGAGPIPMNRQGTERISNTTAYLEPARGRTNLTVRGDAHVRRILVERGQAVGVELHDGETVTAGHVVLAAGVIQTPLLLGRSGIRRDGPVHDLPAVGRNLTDHMVVSYRTPVHPSSVPDAGPTLQTIARATAPDSDRRHDIQLTPIARRNPDGSRELEISVALQLPDGTGYVEPTGPTTDARAHIVWPFAAIVDNRTRLRAGWRLAAKVAAATGIAQDPAAVSADLARTDVELDTMIAETHYAFYHGVGTCRLGNEPTSSVVTPDLAVHGLAGLHIVDASVIPSVPRANTHLLVTALAEYGAERLAQVC